MNRTSSLVPDRNILVRKRNVLPSLAMMFFAALLGLIHPVYNFGDTISWTQATAAAAFSAREYHTSLSFNNKLWVIAGSPGGCIAFNDVWSSSDGAAWNQVTGAPFSGRWAHASVVFNNKMWVTGGVTACGGQSNLNDVWSSPDGLTWTQATGAAAFSAREQSVLLAFNNKLWIIAGYGLGGKNDVWSSPDGITWTQATGAAAFSPRWAHTGVVFNNKMWVIGGYDGANKNDVWSSPDGVTWTQVTGAAAFVPRFQLKSVVLNNKIWVTGGSDGTTALNDVWSSADGITWTQATGGPAFLPRYAHGNVVLNDKVWIIAGGSNSGARNDVWYSSGGGPADLAALIDIAPDTLNKASRGRWVTAYVTLPAGFNATSIIPASISITHLLGNGCAPNYTQPVDPTSPSQVGDHDQDGIPDLAVSFDRQLLTSNLCLGNVTITVEGNLTTGEHFTGTDRVNVINREQ